MKTLKLQKKAAPILLAAATTVFLPNLGPAALLDLTDGGPLDSGSLVADVGGTAIFSLAGDETKPSGTGIFSPFLRLGTDGQGSLNNKNIEQGYNTDGRIGGQAPLDSKESPHTHSLQLQDLCQVTLNGSSYYVFELDAHEPDASTKKLLSIDNIRIYTAPEADGGDATTLNIDSLGTLRFALNNPNFTDPNLPGGEPENWVKFDASHDYSTGSGQSDLYAYIPASAFTGALGTDYLYFYNLNGVHYKAENSTAAEGTFEEWRALCAPPVDTPDSGGTLALLGAGVAALGFYFRRSQKQALIKA